jgi:hypothetical protein
LCCRRYPGSWRLLELHDRDRRFKLCDRAQPNDHKLERIKQDDRIKLVDDRRHRRRHRHQRHVHHGAHDERNFHRRVVGGVSPASRGPGTTLR